MAEVTMNHEVTQADILKERLDEVPNKVTEGTRENATDGPIGNRAYTDHKGNPADPAVAIEKGNSVVTRGSGAVVADTCYKEREAVNTEEGTDVPTV